MNCELCNYLDQLAITFDATADVEIVRTALRIKMVISKSENERLESKIHSKEKFKIMFDYLKAKDENDVLDELQRICIENRWTYMYNDITRERCGHTCRQPSSLSGSSNNDQIIKTIRENLLKYLKDDVELLFKYWDNLGVPRNDKWEKIFNINIDIRDINGKKFTEIDTFEKLFEIKKFKRIIITGPAGYGKSTFVHELARQWVNGSNWSSQFKLILLVRLGEIKKVENEKFSLKDLFKKCLLEKDAEFVFNVMDQKLCSEMLLIFDGFDEMIESHVSSEVLDIILGRSTMKPFVILTSRPECLEKIKGACNLYIELKGFTEKGSDLQLKKFGINNLLEEINGDIVKVPLFCTLFGIITLNNDNADFHNVNICQLIDKTVEYLLERYQKVHTDLKDKSELFCALGRVALAQLEELRIYEEEAGWFRDLESSPTGESLRLQNFRKVAIDANLIMSNSSDTNAYFPHRMFAEYFAAYYLNAKGDLKLDNIVTDLMLYRVIRFTNNSCCEIDNWLICFLTYFDSQLKTEIWNLFATFKEDLIVFPLFDEFDALPTKKITARRLWFSPLMSANVVSSLANKLDVPLNILIIGAQLKSAFGFSNTTKITHVTFSQCKLHVSGAEILKSFCCATAMEFKFCEMFCRKEDEGEFVCTTDFQNRTLESVVICQCSGDLDIFLSPFRKLRKDVVRIKT